ncbi:MAG: response regulator [Sphingomonadaceae bacterium]|nr:response regulator [Sphingomonadaceae bacterium]
MASHQLAGTRLLIVEDEYYLADDAKSALSEVGAEVLGPVATVSDARDLIEGGGAIDGVLLDINLRGEMAFEVADTLQSRGIPFAFVTGYDSGTLPERFSGTESLQKPVDPRQLVSVFGSLAASRKSNPTD